MKLNLGSGQRPRRDCLNIDVEPSSGADIIHDLEQIPWPLETACADEVYALHVLEHLRNLGSVMQELYRVMAPGGMLHIEVPHPRSDTFIGDPTHVTFVTLDTLNLFSRECCATARERGWANTPLADYLNVDFKVIEASADVHPTFDAMRADETKMDFAVRHYANALVNLKFKVRRL